MSDKKNTNSSLLTPKLKRRDFLAAAGVGAISTALPSVLMAEDISPESWADEADVIVVGSGAAAGAAAAKALDMKRSVIVLEKAPIWGGTSAKSGGGYWICNNRFMKALGLEDPREDAIRLMARLAYPEIYDANDEYFGIGKLDYDLLAVFYDRGSEAIDELDRIGALKSMMFADRNGNPNFPDYTTHIKENKAPNGRALRPLVENGMGGVGIHLARQMKSYVEDKGAKTLMRHRVVSLIVNKNEEVVGVLAENASGERLRFRAKRGVVYGSGGFTQNPEYRQHYLRGPVFGGCAVPTNEGDFVRAAGAIGAAMGNMQNAFWGELLVEQAVQSTSVPAIIWVPPGRGMFYVNKYGHRVVDELTLYNERTQAHFYWDADKYEFPNLILFMIWDQKTQEEEEEIGRFPIPRKGVKAPYVIEGQTFEELAEKIGSRLEELGAQAGNVELGAAFADNLKATRQRFNSFAEKGEDDDFNRGSVPAGKFIHEGGLYTDKVFDIDAPNKTMAPLSEAGPYYCAMVGPGTLDTKGGPRTDVNAQVVNQFGDVIPGLYGAGNCVASPTGNAYFSGGGTLGPALTFGYIAGEHAANSDIKEV